MDTGDVGNPIPAKPESASDSDAATGMFFCRSGKLEFEPGIKEVAPKLNPEFAVPVKLCGIPANSNKPGATFSQTIQNVTSVALLLARPNETTAQKITHTTKTDQPTHSPVSPGLDTPLRRGLLEKPASILTPPNWDRLAATDEEVMWGSPEEPEPPWLPPCSTLVERGRRREDGETVCAWAPAIYHHRKGWYLPACYINAHAITNLATYIPFSVRLWAAATGQGAQGRAPWSGSLAKTTRHSYHPTTHDTLPVWPAVYRRGSPTQPATP